MKVDLVGRGVVDLASASASTSKIAIARRLTVSVSDDDTIIARISPKWRSGCGSVTSTSN